jgi:two-component system chemotaxis sensor kinase CheA
LRLVSGSTVLEQGDIALLVNVPELMRQAGKQPTWSYDTRPPAKVVAEKIVLVAEDSELTRDFLVEVLRTSGYRVIEAMDGQDAMRQIGEVTPSLVISDLDMPIMDGLELVKRIRSTKTLRDIPVIMFTTHGSETDRRRALEVGANAYLVKTAFREETFLNTVESFIGKAKGTTT